MQRHVRYIATIYRRTHKPLLVSRAMSCQVHRRCDYSEGCTALGSYGPPSAARPGLECVFSESVVSVWAHQLTWKPSPHDTQCTNTTPEPDTLNQDGQRACCLKARAPLRCASARGIACRGTLTSAIASTPAACRAALRARLMRDRSLPRVEEARPRPTAWRRLARPCAARHTSCQGTSTCSIGVVKLWDASRCPCLAMRSCSPNPSPYPRGCTIASFLGCLGSHLICSCWNVLRERCVAGRALATLGHAGFGAG